MATNAKALKAVYEALGGEEELVNPTNLEVLNKIAELGGGEAQDSNAKAIMEIAENPPSGGGGTAPTLMPVEVVNDTSNKLTAYGLSYSNGDNAIICGPTEVGGHDHKTIYLSRYSIGNTVEGFSMITFANTSAFTGTTIAATDATLTSVAHTKGWYYRLHGNDETKPTITVSS